MLVTRITCCIGWLNELVVHQQLSSNVNDVIILRRDAIESLISDVSVFMYCQVPNDSNYQKIVDKYFLHPMTELR